MLDIEYYLNFSGDKNISKMFNLLIESLEKQAIESDYIQSAVNMLANIIINKFFTQKPSRL